MVNEAMASKMAAILSEAGDVSGAPTAAMRNDKVKPVLFFSWLQDVIERCWKRYDPEWREHHTQGLANGLYYLGLQRIRVRPSGGIDVIPDSESDPIYIQNHLGLFLDDVVAQGVQSQPQLLFTVLNPDEILRRSGVRRIHAVTEKLLRDGMPQALKQSLFKNAQCWGDYCVEIVPGEEPTMQQWGEEYEERPMDSPAYQQCLDCDNLSEDGQGYCPQCASVNVRQVGGEQGTEQVQTSAGYSDVTTVTLREVVTGQQRYSLLTGAALSPYRIVDTEHDRETFEKLYWKTDDKGRGGWPDVEDPMRVLRRAGVTQQQRGIWNGVGGDATEDKDIVICRRVFLEPEMLMWVSSEMAVQVTNSEGETEEIPAGVALSDVFPEGLCVSMERGCTKLTPESCRIDHGSHRQRFADGMYSILPGKKHGRGVTDARVYNRHLNIIASAQIESFRRQVLPSIAVNSRIFRDAHLFNRPNMMVEVQDGQLPPGENINQHFAYIQPAQQNDGLGERIVGYLQSSMQGAMRSLTFGGPLPTVDNETAYAAAIGQQKSGQMADLWLSLFGEFVRDAGLRMYREFRKQAQGNQYRIPARNPASGDEIAMELAGDELPETFICSVKPGSSIPQAKQEKIAATQAALALAPGLMQMGVMPSRALDFAGNLFGVELAGLGPGDAEDICLDWIQAITEASGEAEQLSAMAAESGLAEEGEAMAVEYLASLCDVDPYAKNNDFKVDFLRTWLDKPDARKTVPVIRAAVRKLIDALMAADLGFMAGQQTMAGMAANQVTATVGVPPGAEGQNGSQQKQSGSGGGSATGEAASGLAAGKQPDYRQVAPR